jgi:hypothetical protein
MSDIYACRGISAISWMVLGQRCSLDWALDATTAGERERLQSMDGEDTGHPDFVGTSAGDSQDQVPSRTNITNSRGQKSKS